MSEQTITVRLSLPDTVTRADAMQLFGLGTELNGAKVTGIYQGDHFAAFDTLQRAAIQGGVVVQTVAG